mmetsp:Transcript_21214/g.68659  ORF Transcript_21214/g.68659 Transcript_21214/m.68659 type:complete len:291 (+) Transcript_21214:545-1417(+)
MDEQRYHLQIRDLKRWRSLSLAIRATVDGQKGGRLHEGHGEVAYGEDALQRRRLPLPRTFRLAIVMLQTVGQHHQKPARQRVERQRLPRGGARQGPRHLSAEGRQAHALLQGKELQHLHGHAQWQCWQGAGHVHSSCHLCLGLAASLGRCWRSARHLPALQHLVFQHASGICNETLHFSSLEIQRLHLQDAPGQGGLASEETPQATPERGAGARMPGQGAPGDAANLGGAQLPVDARQQLRRCRLRGLRHTCDAMAGGGGPKGIWPGLPFGSHANVSACALGRRRLEPIP